MRSQLKLLLGERRGTVAALALSSILSGFTEAGILAVIAQVAATLVSGARWVHMKIGPFHMHARVGTLFLIAVALALARLALQAPLSILPARIAADVQFQLRRGLFHAFTHASWDVQSRDREGHLQETMTSQVIQATGGALQATTLVTALFTFIVLMISALALNARAAAVVLAAALLLFGFLRPLRALGVRRARALSKAQMEYAGGIGEAIRVAEETQVFGVAAAQRSRIDGLVATARDLFFRTQLLSRLIPNLYQSFIYLLIVAGLAGLYTAGSGHVAALGAVVLLLLRAGSYGQQVQSSYQALQQSLPFIERLQEAEQRYTQSSPLTGERPLGAVETLAFERVSFAYRPGRPVLCEVDFEVGGGETVGVIGPSGTGKSTLVQILLQLRAPEGGRYLVNGVCAEQFAREDWHRRVAYVPQEPRLVHASVAENIRYFRALGDEDVERAARLARIHEDVVSWPKGYETIVGPRADAVSGGQQQRICLARALAGRPQVLVLDEPTSALDPHSEALIQESLLALEGELTLFIVAHRMSTLDICDRVMVVIDGRLEAFDTLDRLRTHNAYYRTAAQLAAGTPAGASPGPETNGSHAALGRVPDFFIAGHPKCGTTALYEMLRRHPQIYMPAGKEPWFFASELHVRTPPRPDGTPRTLEQYLALFQAARPEQRVGEASALYLWSRTAAARIAEVQPDARIVAILREPASFLRSLHMQFVQTYVETENDLRRAIALERERREGRNVPRYTYWPDALLYSEHVRYVEQLRRYHEVFAREQVLVLIYDDFRADNRATVRRVLRFLGVDEELEIEPTEANPTVRARSQRLHELVHTVSVGRGPLSRSVKAGAKAFTSQRVRREALHATQRHLVFAPPRPPDEELMLELRRRFRGEVEMLSEYLGRDLVSLWGYDGAG